MKKSIIISALIAIILEIFVFNFSFFSTILYKEEKLDLSNVSYENIFFDNGNNLFIKNEDNYFEISINDEVKNIYIDVFTNSEEFVDVSIDYTDSANLDYEKYVNGYKLYKKRIIKNNEKSKYINFEHLGDTGKVKFIFHNLDARVVYLDDVIINKREPFCFNFLRLFIFFGLSLFCILYKTNQKFKLSLNKHKNIVIWSVIVVLSFITIFYYTNTSKIKYKFSKDIYFELYKDAVESGHLYLDDNLVACDSDNLYDYTTRNNRCYFDISYYKGKYYLYFSVLPLIFTIVFKVGVITLACVFSVVSLVYLMLFINKLIDRYYDNVNIIMRILIMLLLFFNSRILLLVPYIRFYEYIIICAFMFSVIGIYYAYIYSERGSKFHLLISSLCLGLSIFCRPNMIIVSVFSFFIIGKRLLANIKNDFYSFFTPYFLIGLIMMYINYVRFDNVFEFGFHYQLTGVNNQYSKFGLYTNLNGIYNYLLKFPTFSFRYPYIYNNMNMIPFSGYYFNASNGNGIITMSVIGLIIPFFIKIKNNEKYRFVFMSLLFGIILLLIDNASGGSLKRYSLEFAWLFVIPICLLVPEVKKKNILFIAIILSCILNFYVSLDTINDDYCLEQHNSFYYNFEYFFK